MYQNQGFTLIELLVVVLIIGILSAVALPQYEKAVEKSRTAEALMLVKAIGQANQAYFLANGKYATDLRDLDVEVPGEDGEYSNVPRRISRYFSYRAALDEQDVALGIALANRLPISTRYAIGFMPDGSLKCYYKQNEKEQKFCEQLNIPAVPHW